MTDVVKFQLPSRKLSKDVKASGCRRQKTQDGVFNMTQGMRSREETRIKLRTPSPPPDDDLDLNESEKPKPDVDEIKKRLYQRECTRLGVTPVGAFLRAPTRQELQMRHYSLGPTGARALSVPLMLDSTLTSLDLEGNALGPDGLANLMEMLMEHCSLTHLNLKRNNLASRGALLICKILHVNRLILSLNASANEFCDKDSVYFANMLRANTTLKSLDLSDNMLGQVAGRQLGDALKYNDTLESLDLSWNQLREGGAVHLMNGMKENSGLKTLTLTFNCFGRGSCEKPPDALGDMITENSTLENLDVSHNRLSDIDLFGVAKAVRDNEALHSLKIGHNLVTVKAASALIKSLLVSETSKLKILDMTDLPIAENELEDIEELRTREVKIIHGLIHQKETDFDSGPDPSRQKPEDQEDVDGEIIETDALNENEQENSEKDAQELDAAPDVVIPSEAASAPGQEADPHEATAKDTSGFKERLGENEGGEEAAVAEFIGASESKDDGVKQANTDLADEEKEDKKSNETLEILPENAGVESDNRNGNNSEIGDENNEQDD